MIFTIPTSRLETLKARIAGLARRAARLGQDCGIAVAVGKPTVVEHTFWVPAEGHPMGGYSETLMVEVATVEVTGEAPQLAGWTFRGVAKHEVEGVFTHAVGDDSETPEWFADVDAGRCDHCGLHRARATQFLVEHEDGTQKVVGSTCVKDFLGWHKSPEDIATYLELVTVLVRDLEEDWDLGESWQGDSINALNLRGYLHRVAASIREDGWMSKGKAWEDGTPERATATVAWWDCVTALKARGVEATLAKLPQVTDSDRAKADAALEWIRSDADDLPTGDYGRNLALVCGVDYVREKNSGIAASLLVCYERHLSAQVERQARKDSEWVGEVKKRQVFDRVTVERTPSFETMYGTRYIVAMRDADGNVLVWKTSDPPFSVEVGAVLRVKATVKAHETYRGVKQTVVTRLAVEEILEPGAHERARIQREEWAAEAERMVAEPTEGVLRVEVRYGRSEVALLVPRYADYADWQPIARFGDVVAALDYAADHGIEILAAALLGRDPVVGRDDLIAWDERQRHPVAA